MLRQLDDPIGIILNNGFCFIQTMTSYYNRSVMNTAKPPLFRAKYPACLYAGEDLSMKHSEKNKQYSSNNRTEDAALFNRTMACLLCFLLYFLLVKSKLPSIDSV